jgi:hypothetical protein
VRRSWLIHAVVLAGCVENFGGANVQIDLSPATPSQALVGRPPQMLELPSNIHFRLLAIRGPAGAEAQIEVTRFEIHKIVDPTSPCFIDVGPNVPFPGVHVTQFALKMSERTGITDVMNPPPGATMQAQIEQATAVQRMRNVEALAGDRGLKAVTSASPGTYPPVDATCTGGGLPPPMCIDDASNARRLQICTGAWRADPDLFEGTDRVLTSPLNGTTFGFVIGLNPTVPPPVQIPVGGAQLVVPDPLEAVDAYAIDFRPDGAVDPGTLLLTGRPTSGAIRGVTHVHMDSPLLPGIVTAELAIFTNLDDDDVHF